MIKELKMFTIECDGCGHDVNEDNDYSCWSELEPSLETARDDGWYLGDDDIHYCPNCHEFDDDDKLVLTFKKKMYDRYISIKEKYPEWFPEYPNQELPRKISKDEKI